MHFENISATPAKTGFFPYFFHSERKNKRETHYKTKKMNLHNDFGILEKGGAKI